MTPFQTNTSTELTKTSTARIEAIEKLHALSNSFAVNGALVGPDPVGRLNFRFWRFLYNHMPPLWKEEWNFLQTQAYWTLANLILFKATGRQIYWQTAEACAQWIVEHQREDGAWNYPRVSHERLGLIATVEGAWAALALLEFYKETRDERFLSSAIRWNSFVEKCMGYSAGQDPQLGSFEAVNYYWPVKPRGRVTNNSTLMLNFSTWACDLTGDEGLARHCDGLRKFIRAAQLPSGEFWYYLGKRQHYLCYQYNAYQFLDLIAVYRRQATEEMREILARSMQFLRKGQNSVGECLASCERDLPHITYHTAVLAHAFSEGSRIGLGDDLDARCGNAVELLIRTQRPDGGWDHSERDYGGLLKDRRVYPRYLAMTLYHLCSITWPELQAFTSSSNRAAPASSGS